MKVSLALLYCFIVAVVRARSSNKGRIIGGSFANAGQFPYMAAINVQTATSRFFCGGALANYRWIITSGTCVYNATLFTIRLGSIYLDGADAHMYATSVYVVHPGFDPDTLKDDIGLIRLRMYITSTDYIISIITYLPHIEPNSQAHAMGWGHTDDFETNLSNRLRHVTVTALPDEICRHYYGNQVTTNMTCVSGELNEGICLGDTGSPLALMNSEMPYILGIASFISGNGCESVEPSGYTKTAPYVQWIDSYVYAYHPDD